MAGEYNRDGLYCLLISILMELTPKESITLYELGPEHPQCQKFLKRKAYLRALSRPKNREEERKFIQQLRKKGYSLEEIAYALGRNCSTIRRALKKMEQQTISKAGPGDAA